MKYLYVLASTNRDTYAEQAFVSITSLRIHNKNAFVSLLIDDKTDKNLDERKFELKKIADEIIVAAFDESVEQKDRSRQLKTNMRNLVRDDFLYIDCDTVICENLESIWNCEHNLAAVPDRHMDFNHCVMHKEVCEMFRKISKNEIPIEESYFCGGVLFVKECEENITFFNKWNEYWNLYKYKNIFYDQISLAFANAYFKFPISELDGIWNCQIQNCFNYLSEAKILHYFATNDFEYGNFTKNIPMSLKELGFLTEDNLREIKNPKRGYPTPHWAISGNDYEIFRSKIFDLFRRRTRLFSMLEKFYCFVRSIWLKVKGVK